MLPERTGVPGHCPWTTWYPPSTSAHKVSNNGSPVEHPGEHVAVPDARGAGELGAGELGPGELGHGERGQGVAFLGFPSGSSCRSRKEKQRSQRIAGTNRP